MVTRKRNDGKLIKTFFRKDLMRREIINQFIEISIEQKENIVNSCCIIEQNNKTLFLQYYLSNNDCLFDISPENNSILITIQKDYFTKYHSPIVFLNGEQNICCNTQSKIFDYLNSNLEGVAKILFTESIILYLLFQTQKNSLVFKLDCSTCTTINKQIDEEKVSKAKEYILQNLDKNLTIPLIAKYVGTNQCYLKNWFKEFFGQTIFEFIQQNRMIKAKYLLIHTNNPITSIAQEIGYASVSSFSQTYKNYFGISPSIEQKN